MATLAGVDAARPLAFAHEAVVYDGDDEYVAQILPFLQKALTDDQAILVAVPAAKTALLQEALDGDRDRVLWADMAELGRNPARIIPAWRAFLVNHEAAGRSCCGVSEPAWPGRRADEFLEAERHESLLNLAFDGGAPWQLLCPYDGRNLPDAVLASVGRTHRHVAVAGERRASDEFESADPFAYPAPPVVLDVPSVTFGVDRLADVRAFVADHGHRFGLPTHRTADLVFAANEIATNSVRYGGGHGAARVWNDGQRVVCEIRDEGRITDPLVGRVLPPMPHEGGRGLWLANQLCDLVQVWSGAGGTVVRLHMRR